MSNFPVHPRTGLQAIGIGKRGPIWPVMGASEDHEPAPQEDTSDKGFPADTPVDQMTDAQKAAYYRHQNRQTDNKLKAFHGFTPQDVNLLWTRVQELESEKLSADEKSVKDAAERAAQEARAAAEAELRPKLLTSQLKAAASDVISGDKLSAWISTADPAKFTGEDGEIDAEKVQETLTALFGNESQGRQWGQYGSRPPGKSASEEGLAEARRRGYIKD
ncbi:head scaffolding protein [Mycobacterium phage Cornie]|uniref:Scaffolding protein n=1 Tax=Mycobacterium phage Cornie TaxID=2704043 RepID=A0A6G6XJV6_9CAUD|nr:head scaffolding protein [Mycobacterium phage Cornie]QIG58382.1 scaffolding protein [Mycobacterium phage Cornie]